MRRTDGVVSSTASVHPPDYYFTILVLPFIILFLDKCMRFWGALSQSNHNHSLRISYMYSTKMGTLGGIQMLQS